MLRKDEPDRKLWLNAYNDVIELRAFNLPPDIPVSLRNAKGLLEFYEAGAKAQNGEVLQLEKLELHGLACIRLELQLPAKPRGWTFVGSLTLPYKDGSFVIKAQGMEVLETRQNLEPDTDAQHPEHALSRVRHALDGIEESLQLDLVLAKLEPFERKSWWPFGRS